MYIVHCKLGSALPLPSVKYTGTGLAYIVHVLPSLQRICTHHCLVYSVQVLLSLLVKLYWYCLVLSVHVLVVYSIVYICPGQVLASVLCSVYRTTCTGLGYSVPVLPSLQCTLYMY